MFVGTFPLSELSLPKDALALVDVSIYARQEAAARDARIAEDAARQALVEANEEWREAHAALNALRDQAVEGGMPPLETRLAAKRREAEAREDAEWRQRAWEDARKLRERAEAEAVVARQAAQREALQPWAEDRVLVAWSNAVKGAQRIDRVLERSHALATARRIRLAQPHRQDWPDDLDQKAEAIEAELLAARADLAAYLGGEGREAWDCGFAVLHALGAARPARPAWPQTEEAARRMNEAAMRRHFQRPRVGESFAAPVFNPHTDPRWMIHAGDRNRAARRA